MLCEWCYAADAVASVELKPATMGTDKRTGTRVVKKPAKKVNVCRACKTTVERQLGAERL